MTQKSNKRSKLVMIDVLVVAFLAAVALLGLYKWYEVHALSFFICLGIALIFGAFGWLMERGDKLFK